jgi:selenocysteine lyase/cysteine desulfurase
VTSGAEFPGVAHAWLATRALGWEAVFLEAGVGTALAAPHFAAAVDERTAVVSFPHVCYANGALIDPAAVAAAAHEAGALAFLDGYQSVGTTPVDVGALGVDALAAGTLKYLMGTSGIAFLYVRPELRDRLEPTVTGWFGRVDPLAFDSATLDFAPRASRFDLGTPPVANAYAARAGIELVAAAGPSEVRTQVERLSARAFELAGELGLRILGPRSVAAKGATTALDAGSTERARLVQEDLRERRVIASARGRGVRLAPHGFTRMDELEHAMRATAALLGSNAGQG